MKTRSEVPGRGAPSQTNWTHVRSLSRKFPDLPLGEVSSSLGYRRSSNTWPVSFFVTLRQSQRLLDRFHDLSGCPVAGCAALYSRSVGPSHHGGLTFLSSLLGSVAQ